MKVWGSKSLRRRVSSGVFVCPAEATERAYWAFRVRTWFSLFSIPVIPMKTVGEHVECFCCGAIYQPQSLTPAIRTRS